MVYYLIPGTLDPSFGVYIYSTDGYYFKPEDWSINLGRIPNGVAIVTENANTLVALNDIGPEIAMSEDAKIHPRLPQLTDDNEAFMDYDGYGNTIIIYVAYDQEGIMSAAEACYKFVFPDGEEGYIGALGEWNDVKNNIESVNSALKVAGGAELSGNDYWTSTRADDDDEGNCYFWAYGTLYNSLNYNIHAESPSTVRAFRSL